METKQVKKKSNNWKIFSSGIITSNPIFVLFLGMCPVLATTSTFSSAFGMGLAVIAVLVVTNTLISLIRKLVPNEIRIPVYIVIIATVVTIVEMLMYAFMFDLAQTLGVYLSIIVVNCVILGRAESFASKNTVFHSFLDGLGTGLGFLLGVVLVALTRETIGTGGLGFNNPLTGIELFHVQLFPQQFAISLFTVSPGAFIVYGLLTAAFVAINAAYKDRQEKKAKALAKVAQAGGNQ